MEVKIPPSAIGKDAEAKITKQMRIIDIPGHYHFKDKLIEGLEDAKAIILVVDSKEK